MPTMNPPVLNAQFIYTFYMRKTDGTINTSPAGMSARLSRASCYDSGDACRAATNTPTVLDSTSGCCQLVLTAADMNADVVAVRVNSTDGTTLPTTNLFYTAAITIDDIYWMIYDAELYAHLLYILFEDLVEIDEPDDCIRFNANALEQAPAGGSVVI